MDAAISQRPASHSTWPDIVAWLALFLSPIGYFLLLLVWAELGLAAPPAGLVVALFCLIPIVALWMCSAAVWRKTRSVGLLIAVVLGIALQVAFLLVVIISAITVAISLP